MSTGMKSTFIAAWVLFVTGLFLADNAVIGTSVIIFVVLGCTVEIIEAINKPIAKGGD